jgi:hypothetical protein
MNPKYQILAQQRKVFQVSGAQAGTTIAAGHVAPPAAAAATLLSILNPVGSSVNLEIIQASIGHISGTPGAGTFTYCYSLQNSALDGVAEAGAIKRCLYSGGVATVAKAWAATTLTGGVVHYVQAHFPSAPFAGALAATAEGTAYAQVHDVDGMIIVPPGMMLTLAPAATGTSHVVAVSITYAEVANGNG